MRSPIAFVCFIMFFASASGIMAAGTDKGTKDAAFSFANVQYFHRYTQNDQNEYTPAGQEDLKAWTDMMTINYYPKSKDGDGLAATANAVLQTYKANKGVIVNTQSVPRTKDKPAEHLIVAVLGRPEFLEAVFARFILQNGVGVAVIYSHRIYGKEIGNQMSAWLKQQGPATEKTLMQWETASIPRKS